MIFIGNHVSISHGYEAMGIHEKKLGGNTFAFFTRNPRGGKSKKQDPSDIRKLISFLKKEKFGPLVAHAPYTMNLCSAREDVRQFAENVFREDLAAMELLPGNFFNFHPGSHTGMGVEKASDIIAEVLNKTLARDQRTTVLLETMAGKGTEVGRTFEELGNIIKRIDPAFRDKVGICFDTCHVWDAGYNIKDDLDGVLEAFDAAAGIDRLRAVHLNDSMNECGSHKDRHEKLGKGKIGKEALTYIIRHPSFKDKPFILETPNDDEGYMNEISFVKENMI